jgi:hypothetical protein
MSTIEITLTQLRGMIGLKVVHQGTPCQIIEVIEINTSLVLQTHTTDKVIQLDQHGDAHRRVPDTITIPVLTADKTELHPVFLALDLV